uniref:Uncharacterized protein n=1 Tax=Nelumbo nucifera TaxID=4432 RepID=A0A822Z9U3_NELNU|nr:TPA_asm: hypothetical protein HUJ06_008939 [Nelumbo nucifera]
MKLSVFMFVSHEEATSLAYNFLLRVHCLFIFLKFLVPYQL